MNRRDQILKKRGLSRRLLSVLLALMMLLSLLPTAVFAADPTPQTYKKVTQAPEDWSGTYLIVSEGDKLIMDGSLTNLDAEGNKVDVTISDGVITGDFAKYAFTIEPMTGGYAIKSASGKYISGTQNKNKLNSADTAALNTIELTGGNIIITSNGTTLQYNHAAYNGTRFRYYKSQNQQPITLYKLDAVPARQSGIITDLTTLQDGDTVVVFNPNAKKAMSADATGTYYRAGKDIKIDGNTVTDYGDTELWTVNINADGTYTFSTADGKKLSMNADRNSLPLDEVNNTWNIKTSATADCFYIVNANRSDYYVEWFVNSSKGFEEFTTYTYKAANENLYALQLYLVIKSDNPEPTPTPEPTLADGKYVIYNPGSGKAMSADATGTYYRAGKDVTVTNGKVAEPAEDLIWTVTSENGVYTITTADGKKLSMNADRNSLPLDEVNDTWTVKEATTADCFYLINANRPTYYVEWFVNSSKGFEEFTTYTYKASNESLYALQFIPVEQPLVPDGKYVIYNPDSGKAMSADATGTYYRAGKDVTVTDGKVNNPASDLVWTVSSTDGVYTITTADGKKLSMNADRNSLPLDEVNNTWTVKEATTADCFYLINANRSDYYVEWFVNSSKGYQEFTTYTYKAANEKLYALQFIPVDGGSSDPSTGLPNPDDQVVIYNQNAQAVLAAQNDNTDSPAINKAAATIEDGKAVCANGAVVFEVQKNGDYYRFYNQTYGYLCANGTGNNAFYSQTASDDADWTVRTCSGGVGGYEMEHRTAKYNGKYSQWLEYYSDSFKVYSMYNVTDYTIYSFSFYPVGPGTISDGIVNTPTVSFGNILDAYVGQDYELTFTVDAPFGVRGDMTARLNSTELTVTKGEDGTYTVYIPDALVQGDKLTVNISGLDNKYIPFYATAEIPVKDEPVFSNPKPTKADQTGEDKRPEISVALANAGDNPAITMTVNGEAVNASYDGTRVTYTPAADMADGRVDVKVTAKRADSKSAEFSWFFTVGKTTYQLYFGQLHSHTQYSDGSGTLDSALSYIRSIPDSANVQFVAFTDHSNYFDSKNNPNVEGALYDTSLVKDSDSNHSWKTYKDIIAQFNDENAGDMVALGGFEMTWSGGPGHINTFNTPGVVSRNNSTLNNKTDDAGMKAYYSLLSQPEGEDSISQFNHPGTTFGNFKDFNYWNSVIDSRMYMVEVGNGEGQIGAGGYYPSYEQYIMALDKGWHLAPTNNQDNHKGRWGNANDARDVILTDTFTEEGIYDAIRALRMYATEDKNLELDYTVNDNMMGSSITEVPDKLNIAVSVYDPDAADSISKVEVVVNSGKVAHVWDDAAELKNGTLSVTLDPEYSYYFIRVTQADGDLAVTSPVWVGESLKLGISNLVCGTSTPVTEEELTLTTTLFNSESTDATVKSLTYTIGGTVIGTDKTGYTLAKSSTLDIPFKWTPDKARVSTVTVTAVVEQNGKEYTFTKAIELDVLDAGKLVYIGLDGSHHNEYINGNYSDTMGNFQTLANKYGVRLVELMTKDELMNACNNPKFKAIVLTAPSRRDKATGNGIDCYAADELAAIKSYNEKGGIVLVMGYSDYYETTGGGCNVTLTPEQHMAAQQNLVLAELGSKLRLGDDQTSDTVHNDGRDYGIYTASYGTSELLEGLVYSEEAPFDAKYSQVFSQYGGCSVYIVDENGTPVSTVPSTVTPVVYGNATTASGDGDGDGLGGASMPKYDGKLLLLATEKVGSNGMVLVTGGTMMADWQLQVKPEDIDSGADLLYSNYTIMENLLQIINPIQITPISEVQAQKEEGIKYTIEGIVTANASGYDKDTAFFDCIYVQDETGGINCFPVAGNFKVGDKVRVSGTTSSYQGERQLAVSGIEKIGDGTPIEPQVITAAQVNDGSVLGQLITLKGYVVGIEMAEGKVQTILVRDTQGNVARVFIDGYITTSQDVLNLVMGCEITATGLASYDNTFVLEDGTPMYPRIRIRNRADIICTAHTHAFGDWEETTPATCTADGEETRTCVCGATETRAIPATGHTFGDWTVTTPATCTVDGVETRTCACGATETRAIPATGHTFGDWTVTTPATCTVDGVETRTCACGETETRTIPATGHVDADHDGKCDVCQAVITPVDPDTPDNPTPDNPTPDNPTPDTPDKPTPGTPDKPATGDNSAMVLWVSLMSVTALAGAALIRSKKRRA